MKRNTADILKIGVIIPALVLSLAACGSSGSTAAPKEEEKPAEETAAEETEAPAAEETAPEAEAPEAGETVTAYETVENGGVKLSIPLDYTAEIILDVPQDDAEGVLFSVSEKASVEADKALGNSHDGAGWLFSISRSDEETVHQMMCSDMSGTDLMATDGNGTYYLFNHPTDVRLVRETSEQMNQDMDRWTELVEWADSVKASFLQENAGLTAVKYGNTTPEIYFSKVLYDSSVKYTVSTTEFGPMEPAGVDPAPYVGKLLTGAQYEMLDGEEAPDGEYVVLNFPDEDARFDFFTAEGNKNWIRMVWFEEQNEQLYKVTFDDDTVQATDVMEEWYHALVDANK